MRFCTVRAVVRVQGRIHDSAWGKVKGRVNEFLKGKGQANSTELRRRFSSERNIKQLLDDMIEEGSLRRVKVFHQGAGRPQEVYSLAEGQQRKA